MSLNYKATEISSSLKKKGFEEKTGDHFFYILYVDGKKTKIRTKISHGIKEYGISLLRLVWRQLKLDKRGFQDLVECPMSYEDYVEYLEKNGHLKNSP